MKLIRSQFVFPMDRYFKSAHASTIIKNPDGTFAVACFGGEHEGHHGVRIHIASLDKDWNIRSVSMREECDIAHWNPVLYRRDDGEILLWYKVAEWIKDWTTYRISSHDGGYSWDNMSVMVDYDENGGHACGPVKNKPYRTKNGNLLIAPRSVETFIDWTVIPEYSYDDGKTWNECKPIGYRMNPTIENGYRTQKPNGIIQPTVYEKNGEINLLMRSTWGKVYRSVSKDGINWSDAFETLIPNNNSGIDCTEVDGRVYLAYNNVEGNWGARTPLVIGDVTDMIYSDKKEPGDMITLESEKGEFSYPAVISDGNRLYCTYTWNRRNIVICEIEV